MSEASDFDAKAAEVVDLMDARRLSSPVRERPRERFCRHERVELDGEARRVYCSDCKIEVDAFAALLNLSRHFVRWQTRYAQAARAAKQMEDQAAELKRELRNLKARVRRAA